MAQPSDLPPHVPDALLVQFAPGTAPQARAEAARAVGAEERDAIHTKAMQEAGAGVLSVLRLPPGLDQERAAEILARRPGVVSVDRDWIVGVDATSDDPAYTSGQLWGMQGDASDPTNQYGIGAAEAWGAGHTGSTKVVAGGIDTGIDYRHPDLYLNIWLNPGEIPAAVRAALSDTDADGLITFRDLNAAANASQVSDLNGNARIDLGDLLADARWEDGVDGDGNGLADDLSGWDWVNSDNDPLDDNRHGTHTAGTIAGQGGNGAGVAGVAWTAQVVPLKFLGSGGSGASSGAIKAIDYFTAAARAAGGSADFVATNNSWGGGGFSTALRDAINRGANQDILFVAAAGNSSSSTPQYPANYDTTFDGGLDAVLSVASTTSSGGLSSFSNYGSTVDLGAPGSAIYSTVLNGGYASLNGTSMAAPHVTGAAVLYAASNPGASGAQIRGEILDGTPTASLSGRTVTGDRLDVGAMLTGATPPPPTEPPPTTGPATVSIAPTASADAAEGSSGSKAFGFTVSRTGDATAAATVAWTLQHGTTEAADFTGATTGTVSFAAGDTAAKPVSVSVVGDTATEPDETFSVALSNPFGAAIGTASAAGRVRNDDTTTPPPPTEQHPPAGQPSALEQYMLELVNGARASVGAQPIAWNGDLGDAAQKHTDWMFANGTLSHTGEGGSSSRQRMAAEGYDFSGSAIYSGENIAMRAGTGRGLDPTNVKALFDQFMASSGHRANMQRDAFEEIGIGLSGSSTSSWVTQDFAGTSARGPFFTGVAFDDRDGDRAYDAGEGLSGITVSLKNLSTGAVTTTTTMAAGGWVTGKMAAGSYEVAFSDGGLAAPIVKTATLGSKNIKVDIEADVPGAVAQALDVQRPEPGPGRGQGGRPEELVTPAPDFADAAAPLPLPVALLAGDMILA